MGPRTGGPKNKAPLREHLHKRQVPPQGPSPAPGKPPGRPPDSSTKPGTPPERPQKTLRRPNMQTTLLHKFASRTPQHHYPIKGSDERAEQHITFRTHSTSVRASAQIVTKKSQILTTARIGHARRSIRGDARVHPHRFQPLQPFLLTRPPSTLLNCGSENLLGLIQQLREPQSLGLIP